MAPADLFPRPAPPSVLLAQRRSRRNNRIQQIYIDSSVRPAAGTTLQLNVTITPPTKQAEWSQNPTPLDRKELWEEEEPAVTITHQRHNHRPFRPIHRRRPRPRSVARTRGHSSLRKDLSHTLLSAYDAAKAPFRPKGHAARLGRRFKKDAPKEARRRTMRPDVLSSGTNTVEITGPLSSPASSVFPKSSLPLARKFFKQRHPTRVISSPLSLTAPAMPFRSSFNAGRHARNSDPPASRNSGPPALRNRDVQRCRDSFNRAKVHVRRPPKGIAHWFEALDEDSSDEDYPEVVVEPQQPSSAPPGTTTFQPSLGPQRARAAPTSFVTSSAEVPVADYFSYTKALRRRKNSSVEHANTSRGDNNYRSVLDLDSDDEVQSPDGSPAGWDSIAPSPGGQSLTFTQRATMQRKGSAAPSAWTPGARQSMASMQTTFTSATIPFMLRVSPVNDSNAPPLPPTIRHHHASYLALTGRPPTADGNTFKTHSPSIRQFERSAPSTASVTSTPGSSNPPSAAQHYVAVTAEEMELLELMRRKKAALPDISTSSRKVSTTTVSIVEEPESPVSIPQPLNPHRQSGPSNHDDETDTIRSKSRSSTVRLESGEEVTFPIPNASPRISQSLQTGTFPAKAMKLDGLPTPPLTASYWSPDVTTPRDDISELEAIPFVPPPLPLRLSALGSNPPAKRRSSHFSPLNSRIFNGANVTPIEAPPLTQSATMTSTFSASSESNAASTPSASSLAISTPGSQKPPTRHQSVAISSPARTPGILSPRRVRTHDAIDTYNLFPELNVSFSDFQLDPLQSDFGFPLQAAATPCSAPLDASDVVPPSPTLDSVARMSNDIDAVIETLNKDKSLPPLPPVTPTMPSSATVPRHVPPPPAPAAMKLTESHAALLPDEPDFSMSEPEEDDDGNDDDDDDDSSSTACSPSPSLTDGGSLSGHSRSELDTPIKESGLVPRLLGSGRYALHSGAVGIGAASTAGGAADVETGMTREEGSLDLIREEKKLGSPVGADETAAAARAGKERASLEVLDAWRGLGGYEVR